jgi:acetolactate synthase-1/2/3 large subunit
MRAVSWFIQELVDRNVSWIASLCGHGLDPLFRAARDAGIRIIDTRNEQTAAYIAETYGRLTKRPGVVAVSSGVAHANALTGVVNAWFDGAPLLLVSGAGDIRTSGMGHFQDVDQVAMAAPVTRYSRVIDRADRVVQILDEAWQAACPPNPGPVHLTFPLDVQMADVEFDDLIRPMPVAASKDANPSLVADAATHLAASSKPILIAGSGAYYNGEAAAIVDFCEFASIPLMVPIWDRGCVDRVSETYMGVIGAATGGPDFLADADCILLAGAEADYRLRYLTRNALRPDAQVWRIDHGWPSLAERYAAISGKSHADWLRTAHERKQAHRKTVNEHAVEQSRNGFHASQLIRAIEPLITDETVLLIDGGSIGQWVHQSLCTERYPGHWVTCGRSGVVGWGIGGAMGARLAHEKRPILLISGDGAFTFNVADLECAARQGLSFVAVVADDEAWGITRSGHMREYGEPISSSLGPVDFVKLAESLGARAVLVREEQQIQDAVREGLGRQGVTVVHVPIAGGTPA